MSNLNDTHEILRHPALFRSLRDRESRGPAVSAAAATPGSGVPSSGQACPVCGRAGTIRSYPDGSATVVHRRAVVNGLDRVVEACLVHSDPRTPRR